MTKRYVDTGRDPSHADAALLSLADQYRQRADAEDRCAEARGNQKLTARRREKLGEELDKLREQQVAILAEIARYHLPPKTDEGREAVKGLPLPFDLPQPTGNVAQDVAAWRAIRAAWVAREYGTPDEQMNAEVEASGELLDRIIETPADRLDEIALKLEVAALESREPNVTVADALAKAYAVTHSEYGDCDAPDLACSALADLRRVLARQQTAPAALMLSQAQDDPDFDKLVAEWQEADAAVQAFVADPSHEDDDIPGDLMDRWNETSDAVMAAPARTVAAAAAKLEALLHLQEFRCQNPADAYTAPLSFPHSTIDRLARCIATTWADLRAMADRSGEPVGQGTDDAALLHLRRQLMTVHAQEQAANDAAEQAFRAAQPSLPPFPEELFYKVRGETERRRYARSEVVAYIENPPGGFEQSRAIYRRLLTSYDAWDAARNAVLEAHGHTAAEAKRTDLTRLAIAIEKAIASMVAFTPQGVLAKLDTVIAENDLEDDAAHDPIACAVVSARDSLADMVRGPLATEQDYAAADFQPIAEASELTAERWEEVTRPAFPHMRLSMSLSGKSKAEIVAALKAGTLDQDALMALVDAFDATAQTWRDAIAILETGQTRALVALTQHLAD